MGTISGNQIITLALTTLNDPSAVRWKNSLEWLNMGQREIVRLKPSAHTITISTELVPNQSEQKIPSDGVQLMSVTHNMGATGLTPGRPITLTDRELIEARFPFWHEAINAGSIKNYCVDARHPEKYWVFPRAPATAWFVRLEYAAYPLDLVTAGDSISLADEWAPTLVDYLLWKHFEKDDLAPGSAGRAANHKAAFMESVGVRTQVQTTADPNRWTRANPAVAPGHTPTQRQ